jgi:hypothetical protein
MIVGAGQFNKLRVFVYDAAPAASNKQGLEVPPYQLSGGVNVHNVDTVVQLIRTYSAALHSDAHCSLLVAHCLHRPYNARTCAMPRELMCALCGCAVVQMHPLGDDLGRVSPRLCSLVCVAAAASIGNAQQAGGELPTST